MLSEKLKRFAELGLCEDIIEVIQAEIDKIDSRWHLCSIEQISELKGEKSALEKIKSIFSTTLIKAGEER